MNKNGFTLVELLVSIVLSSVVLGLIFETIILLKDIYAKNSLKMQFINKVNLISEKINSDFNEKNINRIDSCENSKNNCILIEYNTYETVELSIFDKKIKYGDYSIVLPEGSLVSDMEVKLYDDENIEYNLSTNFIIKDNSLLIIKIPIKNMYDESNNINLVYQKSIGSTE